MSSIVYRLRERASVARFENTGTALGDAVHFEEAADLITSLRAELERKDAALRVGIKFMSIATDWNLCRVEIDRKWHSTYDLIDDLRAALSAQKEEEA